MTPLIECQDLVVDFGLTRALDRVSLSINPGEIVGLVGPNGAGKSTLGRVFVGEIPFGSYQGSLKLRGSDARFDDSREAHNAGIVLVHQEGAVVEQLSIGENVMLTLEPNWHGYINWPALHDQAARGLSQVGLVTSTRARLADIGGVALVELVEIARSIVRRSSVFVFDESTSALGAEEIKILLAKLRELSARGAGIVFISHRINEVLSICDRVIVLRDGRVTMDASRVGQDHASVVRAMLGGALDDAEVRLRSKQHMRTSAGGSGDLGPTALKLRNWRVPRSNICRINVGPIDIEIRDGEILGLFGPLGAGMTELLQSLFGLYGRTCTGECWMKDKPVAPFSKPAAAIRQGLALVSAERQKEGVVPQLSVLENMMLGHHRKDLSWWKIILNRRAARQLCERLIEELGIQTTGPDETIALLSGGNQQKVLLARAMVNSPRILLLDQPTRGIDVGAKRDVYRWVRAAAARGAAVIVSSLEELELLGLAHRILVLRDGRQLAILDAAKTTEHELLTLAAGGSLH
jgi:ABC-type sugar transport system ATPase subunit